MKSFSVGRLPCGLLWILLLTLATGFAEDRDRSVATRDPDHVALTDRVDAAAKPRSNQQLTYLGTYSAEGRFELPPKHQRWYNQEINQVPEFASRPLEVPPSFNLHPNERSLGNYSPPHRAAQPAKGHSRLASLRDDIVTFAYGREKVLLTPHQIVSDSRGRIIVTDPGARVVHVLDGKNSFRLGTGENRRVEKPNGVAVDADDNIYIADETGGVVAVFDPDGGFLHDIGKLGRDENLFHLPTGIAIDRERGHLYVVDTERQSIFELDLHGNVLRRVGRFSSNDAVVDLESPTAVALHGSHLVVLDACGSRINVMDLQGKLLRRFPTGLENARDMDDRSGFALDADGRVYISRTGVPGIRVFDMDGRALSGLDKPMLAERQVRSMTGLWIDDANRMYVSDESSAQVQVFQIKTTRGSEPRRPNLSNPEEALASAGR